MKFTKKCSLLLALILVLSCLLASCGTTEDGVPVPNGMQAIASETGDYYLMVPSNWITDTVRGMTSAFVEDQAHSSVTVCANELTREIPTIEEYWNSFSEQFKASFADFAMLDELPTDVTVAKENDGTIDAKKYRYTATVGEVKYQWMQVLFIRNATLYILTYTSTAESYESNLDDVNKIIANFTFR
ncbi:MAG: DUF1795 domain-containing protein [Clostridia bacterium]|nr:DUF1795 domain-containing protein [Clostridia bacterium]